MGLIYLYYAHEHACTMYMNKEHTYGNIWYEWTHEDWILSCWFSSIKIDVQNVEFVRMFAAVVHTCIDETFSKINGSFIVVIYFTCNPITS